MFLNLEMLSLMRNVFHWKSKKQPRVSLSTVEAELRAMAYVTKELLWLRSLLIEVKQNQYVDIPWIVKCDNNGAIALSKNPIVSDLSKHIGIQQQFIRECTRLGEVSFEYIKSMKNIADVMTKALPKVIIVQMNKSIGLK